MSEANTKGAVLVSLFRTSSAASRLRPKWLGFPLRFMYRLIVRWFLSVDIPDTVVIGNNLCIYHGFGLVIHEDAVIGDYVTIRHNTTIGNARKAGGAPKIGNHVDIGANSVIIGEITIGDHSIIAAGSVVIRDVPPNVVVAGNPARVVKVLEK